MDGWERLGEGTYSTPAPSLLIGTVWGTSTRLHISGLFQARSPQATPGPAFQQNGSLRGEGSWVSADLQTAPTR